MDPPHDHGPPAGRFQRMNGAEAMVRTLRAGGVDVVFANPGTFELLTVAALDRVEGMRGVLALFEGVATGAADGYARMAGRPAATLLHHGPGLANGLANLHNARGRRPRWSTSSATTRPITEPSTRRSRPTSRVAAVLVLGQVIGVGGRSCPRCRRSGRRGVRSARSCRDADCPGRRGVG